MIQIKTISESNKIFSGLLYNNWLMNVRAINQNKNEQIYFTFCTYSEYIQKRHVLYCTSNIGSIHSLKHVNVLNSFMLILIPTYDYCRALL